MNDKSVNGYIDLISVLMNVFVYIYMCVLNIRLAFYEQTYWIRILLNFINTYQSRYYLYVNDMLYTVFMKFVLCIFRFFFKFSICFKDTFLCTREWRDCPEYSIFFNYKFSIYMKSSYIYLRLNNIINILELFVIW